MLWAALSVIPAPEAALATYVVFIVWRVSVFVVLYHHAREQFSEANFIYIAYMSAAIGGFFIFADFGLNSLVAAAGTFRGYAIGNVVLQVPCVACMLWAARITWPSKAHAAYFSRRRLAATGRSASTSGKGAGAAGNGG